MSALKYLGYLLSGIGALGVMVSSEKILPKIPFLSNFSSKIVLIGSMGIIALGVILMVIFDKNKGSGKVKYASSEVPIYEGEGKKRRIVGYKKVE